MTNTRTNPKVDDAFMARAEQWRDAFEALRTIALDCPVDEDFKWGHLCYTLDGKNIVLMHGFNDYCALLFHKGALLDDPEGILVQQTKHVQSARQIRFTSAEQIADMAPVLKDYIFRAIEVERSGMEVDFKDTEEFDVPEEFQAKLDENPELQEAFESLTPGRQRGYLLYFSRAKQSKTRASRVEKYTGHILDGKGLND